ncbi:MULTISPECIES: aminotransferase [Pseudomonas]|uniref:aminotransferase n=1 Tax=Pseudomonas TaxID=286 RepID=UPI000B58D817|nr:MULTISPECIES: aminotransferase [Pseudomonas]MCL8298133.1 aminotransferase [Pseudomonas mosselii]MCL8339297.1 aminotransferase [Pseudomonas mosselii]MCU9529018.1 aminotransferase [Pseudomonas mosselii]MCU9537544.1 aminotransferase [Pseudomonas mosselii]MCU9541985.1 aminotransferase [Pseudomonas mosselii]
MPLSTLIQRSSQPGPSLGEAHAHALLRSHYDLQGSLQALGSQQDLNFRVDSDQGRFVLKVCHGSYAAIELQAQHAALAFLRGQGVPVPVVRPANTGELLLELEIDGQPLRARLLDYIDGQPLTRLGHLPARVMAELGTLCAEVDKALAGFDHPGLERTLQWDPRHASVLIEHLLPVLQDIQRREQVVQVARLAAARLQPLVGQLPVQAVHLDITDDNVVWARDDQRQWQVQGVIDFGDLLRTWRIADLSVTCAALLHHAEGDPLRILPAISAYHAANPLQEAELRALWPLVLNRAAVLVLSSEQQLAVDPDNQYTRDNIAHEWEIFDTACSVPAALMEAAILNAAGQVPVTPDMSGCVALLPSLAGQPVARVDLGVLSPLCEAGNWEQPGFDQRMLAAQPGPACSLHGQYRLSQTHIDQPEEPATCALGVELNLLPGSPLQAPEAGVWQRIGDGRGCLRTAHWSLWLAGLEEAPADGQALLKGQALGATCGFLSVQLCLDADTRPPFFATPSHAAAWLALCPSPRSLLGFDCDAEPLADPQALLARRDASFARSQKHYYAQPPHIERGWRNYLIDMQGRSYLDMLNNVAVLGHGHPRMVAESARQWSLVNTNSRFHYAAIAEFSERLLEVAPEGFDRVFLVNSGTEANDLAIRLAWAYSGGRDLLSVLEAYHGWSVATDAISTSIADNPQALETRPDWVHPVEAPNTFRGRYRGAGSAADYLRDVDAKLADLDTRGRQLAGMICEPVYGNAGGISLPPGYLREAYAKVRQRGGVCIADEVQVGYGRLGEYFWGFEEQGVVPDIITMAKGMGNGQPLGAVITRREIAEALEAEGYFFSSAGGSPVSCRIGMAVLDVMRDEGLWDNARDVGRHFKARLQALVDKYPLAGAAHGSGFYLGLELVRDRQTLEPATEETMILCDRLRDLGIFMQPTGDYLNILKIKPPMCTTRASVDYFVDCVERILGEGL